MGKVKTIAAAYLGHPVGLGHQRHHHLPVARGELHHARGAVELGVAGGHDRVAHQLTKQPALGPNHPQLHRLTLLWGGHSALGGQGIWGVGGKQTGSQGHLVFINHYHS